MGKNLVVCCDGTANEFARDATNVIRLFSVVLQDAARQVATYHPGIGTMEAMGALTSIAKWGTRLLGKAIGYGLESDVRDIYAFLARFYEPEDRVFLFGFSRGAYTVRAVASLVHLYGLLRPGQESMIPYAIRELNVLNNRRWGGNSADGEARLQVKAAEFRATFATIPCALHFVGVWDTVSSVGWIENPLRLPHTANNPSIRIGRHAVSIDERRAFFRTNLWRPDPPHDGSGPQDLKQVWFPGVHSDVGGGYPDAESGLAKCALKWMASEAHKAGLLIDRARLELLLGGGTGGYSKPEPNAKLHESLTWTWRPAEFILKRHFNWQTRQEERRMNVFRRRTLPRRSLVHETAWLRRGYQVPADAERVTTDPF
jgi:uncharacterized protein (DUF2235 family)